MKMLWLCCLLARSGLSTLSRRDASLPTEEKHAYVTPSTSQNESSSKKIIYISPNKRNNSNTAVISMVP